MTREERYRWEFRIWAQDLSQVRRELERLALPQQPETSAETYLISRATDRCSAKVRSGTLDLKILLKEHQGLEQWAPVLKAQFPVSATTIADHLFPALALDRPHLPTSEYTLDDFLELVKQEPKISVAQVSKERHEFNLDACTAEFAAVTIDGNLHHTVAIESIEPDAVLQLARHLAIADKPNTSYVRKLKHVISRSCPVA